MACQSRMVVIIGRRRMKVPSRKSPRYAIRSTSEARKIRRYFRSVASDRHAGGRAGAGSGSAGAAGRRAVGVGATMSGGLMALATLLEDAGDEVLERRVLHAHVGHGVAVEDRPQDLGHPGTLDLDVGRRP